MKRFIIALSLALVVGLGGGHARADSVGDRAVALVEKMATIVDDNKSNCDAMGDKLSAFFTANAATFKEMKDMEKSMSKEQKDAWAAKYKDRLAAAIQKMTGGLQACMTNPKVMDALKKMQ